MVKTAKGVYVSIRVRETSDESSQSKSLVGIIQVLSTVDHLSHWS